MRDAIRCTAPMNAPEPPPTMPSLMRGSNEAVVPSVAIGSILSNSEQPPVGRVVRPAGREVVECLLGDANDVVLDEFSAFACPVLGMLERAFPFDHGPAVEVVGGHLREHGAEIDL